MRIDAFVWNQDRIDHIAQHSVTPESLKKPVLGLLSFYEQSLKAKTLFTMCWVKRMLGAISSQLLFSFQMAMAIQ